MYRILLLLLISTSALGQYTPSSSKTRFVNGIGLGTKLDAYFGTADSVALYARADSSLMFKYKGTARALAYAVSGGYLPYSDTATMLSPYQRSYNAVTLTGTQTITGAKTFSSNITASARVNINGAVDNSTYKLNTLGSVAIRASAAKAYPLSLLQASDSASGWAFDADNSGNISLVRRSSGAYQSPAFSWSSSGSMSNNGSNMTLGATIGTGTGTLFAKNNFFTALNYGTTGSPLYEEILGYSYDATARFALQASNSYNSNQGTGFRLRISNSAGTAIYPLTAQNATGVLTTETRLNVNGATDNASYQLNVNGNALATTFVKSGGTSSQYLMADGSVSTNSGTTQAISSIKTSTYTISSTDYHVLVDGSGGAFTVTLPTAAGITGRIYVITRTDVANTGGSVTLAANGSETIGGYPTFAFGNQTFQYCLGVQSDGTNWQIVSR
jgi:hypothetical protein